MKLPKKNKMKICQKCGLPIKDEDYQGYCYKCYEIIWDRGFESTTNHANDLFHDELNKKLDNPFTDKIEGYILAILDYFITDYWSCTKCNTIRIDRKAASQENDDEIVKKLLEPCPTCGNKGFLKHQRVPRT